MRNYDASRNLRASATISWGEYRTQNTVAANNGKDREKALNETFMPGASQDREGGARSTSDGVTLYEKCFEYGHNGHRVADCLSGPDGDK